MVSSKRTGGAIEAALEHLGIKLQFVYADHATIYNFAERVEDAPIHTIDASVAPAPITEYPEYNEYPACSPPAQFNTELVVSRVLRRWACLTMSK